MRIRYCLHKNNLRWRTLIFPQDLDTRRRGDSGMDASMAQGEEYVSGVKSRPGEARERDVFDEGERVFKIELSDI